MIVTALKIHKQLRYNIFFIKQKEFFFFSEITNNTSSTLSDLGFIVLKFIWNLNLNVYIKLNDKNLKAEKNMHLKKRTIKRASSSYI